MAPPFRPPQGTSRWDRGWALGLCGLGVIGLYLTMTNTINAHDDMLFAIGVFSLIALPIVVIWFVFFFFFSVKRYLSKSVQNSNINN